ncbi:MAG TPA: nuclear transport factor 2 family protein, partial [Novosphingobium sp.]|nr:nuclear transport factor 2 family protein [Novosphingobium sp.]
APDGIYAIAGFAEARGRAAIAALLETPHHRALMADGCAHLLGPVAICLDGDTATACGHSIVFKSGASGFAAHRVAANRWHLSRRAGQWLVARRDNALLDGNAAARILLSPPAAPHPPQTPPR